MPRYKCNSCGGTYSDVLRDGGAYYHACGPVTNPKYQPDPAAANHDSRTHIELDNPRDERPVAGLVMLEGRYHRPAPHPEERTTILVPCEYSIIAEGKGRTQLE